MSLSEAIEAATAIIACYPNGGANAGDGYIGALTATLASYPKQTALHCADPRRGIVRQCKFLPTVADMVAWLDDMSKSLYRQYDREQRVEQQMVDRAGAGKTQASKARVRKMLEQYHERAGLPPPQGPQSMSGQGRRYSYGEFQAMTARGEVRSRPIGRFEK
jgi:hypothetical protein